MSHMGSPRSTGLNRPGRKAERYGAGLARLQQLLFLWGGRGAGAIAGAPPPVPGLRIATPAGGLARSELWRLQAPA